MPVLAYTDTSKPLLPMHMLEIIALGHVYANSSILKGRLNQMSQMKSIHYLSHKLKASQTNWPTNEKEAFAIFYALQISDQYLDDSEFVIRIDHKPPKYIMDSPAQNKKIQHWTINIHGYNCKTKYIEVKKKVCADMLSCLPYTTSDSNDYNDLSGPDITDKTFEVSLIKSSNILPRTLAQYDHLITYSQCIKEEVDLTGYDLVAEKTQNKELLQLKEELKNGKASQAINSKYIYWILYFTTYERLAHI